MYIAKLETHHFEFLTIGDTEKDAVEMMKRAWARHRKRTGATFTWAEIEDSVWVLFVRLGDTFLNGDLERSGNTTPTN